MTEKISLIEMKIEQLKDAIACVENDIEQDGDLSSDLDSMYCELADLEDELKQEKGSK